MYTVGGTWSKLPSTADSVLIRASPGKCLVDENEVAVLFDAGFGFRGPPRTTVNPLKMLVDPHERLIVDHLRR